MKFIKKEEEPSRLWLALGAALGAAVVAFGVRKLVDQQNQQRQGRIRLGRVTPRLDYGQQMDDPTGPYGAAPGFSPVQSEAAAIPSTGLGPIDTLAPNTVKAVDERDWASPNRYSDPATTATLGTLDDLADDELSTTGGRAAASTGGLNDINDLGAGHDDPNTPRLPRQGGVVTEQRAGTPYLPADQPDVNPVTLNLGHDASPNPEEATRPAEPGMPTGFPAIQRATREAYTDNELRERGAATPGEAVERSDVDDEGTGTVPTEEPLRSTSVQAAASWGVVPTADETHDTGGDPLVEYLLALHRMIGVLRERRKESDAQNTGQGSSLVPADRVEFQAVVNRLESRLADFNEESLMAESNDGRLYRLTMKVRDALENLDYTDDDLFRIWGEVRTEACQAVTDRAGFDEVRGLYECSGSRSEM